MRWYGVHHGKDSSTRLVAAQPPSAEVGETLPKPLHKPREFVKSLPADYEPWGKVDRETAPSGWGSDCSCGCKWAAWLEGELGSDWLVCMNAKSHRAGLLTFEHQGCFEFEYDEDDDEDEAL